MEITAGNQLKPTGRLKKRWFLDLEKSATGNDANTNFTLQFHILTIFVGYISFNFHSNIGSR